VLDLLSCIDCYIFCKKENQCVTTKKCFISVNSGHETWSLILWEENRFSTSDNKVLRKIFGTKREAVTGSWRRVHSEELPTLYSLLNINKVNKSWRMRWVWHVARMGEMRNVHKTVMRKPDSMRLFGRPGNRLGNNFEINLK
jgi:hypothetical protein